MADGWSTSIGRFQFVLGREIGATRFGRSTLIAPASAPGSTPTLVDFKSTFYDLPIAEFRPYRAFDTRQSSALLVQLFAGADVPYGATVVIAGRRRRTTAEDGLLYRAAPGI